MFTDCENHDIPGEHMILSPLSAGASFPVYCTGDGWMVVQRRIDNTTDFQQDYVNYLHGFGQATGNWWLGLDNLRLLSAVGKLEMNVSMSHGWAHYGTFYLAAQDAEFKMTVSDFNPDSTASDALSFDVGQPFGTWDRYLGDPLLNCALMFGGGWWWHGELCGRSSLNGPYTAMLYYDEYSTDIYKFVTVDFVEIRVRYVDEM